MGRSCEIPTGPAGTSAWASGRREGRNPAAFPLAAQDVRTEGARPRRATAYINALGYYELYVNGKKVDDQVLSPAVSDYSKRNLYLTHDVTDYLAAGKNCVALWLGRGWYVRGHPGVIHDGPLVRAQLDLLLPDGTDGAGSAPTRPGRSTPVPSLRWAAERPSAITAASATTRRRELPGWNTDRARRFRLESSGRVFEPPRVTTAAQMVQPNRIIQTIRPVKVSEFAPGVYLVDMGRNLTGWFELRIPAGAAGSSGVKLEYADFPPSGTHLATNNQRDEVIPRGRIGALLFRSRFNYHAFSFVRITGLNRAPSLEDVRGYLIHTAYEPAAEFACSERPLEPDLPDGPSGPTAA